MDTAHSLFIQNFFTGYRTLIAYPSEDIDAVGTRLWKPFANIDAWNAKRGTKLQTAIDIMKHNLGHDDALPCTTNDEGELTCPPHPSTPPRNTRKAMLFFEYSMMLQTIQSVRHQFIFRMFTRYLTCARLSV